MEDSLENLPSLSPPSGNDGIPDRPQFRISTRIVLVAIALGFVIGLAWWNNRQFCLHQAEAHRLQSDVETGEANHLEERAWPSAGGPRYAMDSNAYRATQQEAVLNRSSAKNHARLVEEYEAAAWQPWLRIFIIDP